MWPNLISKCSRDGKKERQGNEGKLKAPEFFYQNFVLLVFMKLPFSSSRADFFTPALKSDHSDEQL